MLGYVQDLREDFMEVGPKTEAHHQICLCFLCHWLGTTAQCAAKLGDAVYLEAWPVTRDAAL